MLTLEFAVINQGHLNAKVKAAEELFGIGQVTAYVQGIFRTTTHQKPVDDVLFFDHAWELADGIGAACCEFSVDGRAVWAVPDGRVRLQLRIKN